MDSEWQDIEHDLDELDRLLAGLNAQVHGNDPDNLASSYPSQIPGQSIILHTVCHPKTEIVIGNAAVL